MPLLLLLLAQDDLYTNCCLNDHENKQQDL
jgi:hypothetical protein